MAGSRTERVADQVKELVSQLLSFDVKDPGVGLVTVTHVKVTGDLSLATVYYTLMDDGPRERKETAKALERATPYLRRRVAEDLNLRRATDLRFHYDEHLERQQRVDALLQQIEADRLAQAPTDAPSDVADVTVPPSTPPRDDNAPD